MVEAAHDLIASGDEIGAEIGHALLSGQVTLREVATSGAYSEYLAGRAERNLTTWRADAEGQDSDQ